MGRSPPAQGFVHGDDQAQVERRRQKRGQQGAAGDIVHPVHVAAVAEERRGLTDAVPERAGVAMLERSQGGGQFVHSHF